MSIFFKKSYKDFKEISFHVNVLFFFLLHPIIAFCQNQIKSSVFLLSSRNCSRFQSFSFYPFLWTFCCEIFGLESNKLKNWMSPMCYCKKSHRNKQINKTKFLRKFKENTQYKSLCPLSLLTSQVHIVNIHRTLRWRWYFFWNCVLKQRQFMVTWDDTSTPTAWRSVSHSCEKKSAAWISSYKRVNMFSIYSK